MTRGVALPPDDDDDAVPTYHARAYMRQLRGWLSYAFASEAFVVVSVTLFLPICLEQFARDNGYFEPERTQRCTAISESNTGIVVMDEARCVVKLGWMWIDSASFSLYVNSTSVALQALTVISMGGIADHPPHRKKLLLGFAALGSISAMLFLVLPSSSPMWPLIALLGMCAYVSFGASIVALNAYLPALARASQEVVAQRLALFRLVHSQDAGPPPHADADDAPLLAPDAAAAQAAHDAALSGVTARLSAQGVAYGYAAGITMLLLALLPVRALGGSTAALRLAVGLSGVWWALFSLPAAAWLPGAAKGARAEEEEEEVREWRAGREVVRAWVRLGGMLRWREVARLRNTFTYLGAWFLLSDCFSTITNTAILFAKTSLHMPASALIVVAVLSPIAGIAGSLFWAGLQRRLGWTTLRTLVVLVVLASLLPLYGCLGLLPAFRSGRLPGGLTTPVEMYVFAVYWGFVYGAFAGYSRAMYAEFIPPGEEARWFGLFSITDKSSSFIGPLIVGIISDATGNIRWAFIFLTAMIWLAVPVLMSVDVERGREDARTYSYHTTR
ncbi:MFS general substrate transporter [Amylocystis lapponica]|nr:MFS general substrate transporter [Amylocystis lapponica]